MANQFHSPVTFWLDLPIEDLYDWTMLADRMVAEEKAKANRQRIGPGL